MVLLGVCDRMKYHPTPILHADAVFFSADCGSGSYLLCTEALLNELYRKIKSLIS